MTWKMNWILKETEKDGKWYECSNCYARIFVMNGEDLPCHCKSCERDCEDEEQ